MVGASLRARRYSAKNREEPSSYGVIHQPKAKQTSKISIATIIAMMPASTCFCHVTPLGFPMTVRKKTTTITNTTRKKIGCLFMTAWK
jgi:hypothetical protein